jgi:NADH pyrophosphatase NudC (nudix superfamily)
MVPLIVQGLHMDNDNELSRVIRYCPKCGAAALRFVGRKLVHCEVCDFDLYLNTAAAVAALITDDQGRLLVVVRAEEPKKGTWDLPGGFADPGESAEEAVRREVKEELGLEVTATRYLCSYPNTYEYGGMRYATMDLGFVCEVKDPAATRVSKDEVSQLLFIRPKEIDTARFGFASVGRIVDRYRAEYITPQG